MNKVIIEGREYGKTTYLFNELMKAKENGLGIYVLDSATEHADKSLIRKVEKTYENVVTIDERDKNKIVLNDIEIEEFVDNYKEFFPFREIIDNRKNILCFDLSYFLEKGHEVYDNTKDKELYCYYRKLYNTLAEQIALSLILSDRFGILNNSLVVTDEIEFPVSKNNISEYQKNLSFLSSVHPENAFGSFYNDFERVKIKKYKNKGKII